MSSIEKLGTWYGELRTQKANITVIRDSRLPTANKGRIYLYNCDRDAIIEYDETIVTPKLFPLSKDAEKRAKSEHDKAWQVAQKKFLRAHGVHSSLPADKEVPESTEEDK